MVFSSSGVMESSVAIWSIKAPVPPAQERTSMEPVRKRILASSPPSSMTTSASGMYFLVAVRVAYTSWTKGMPRSSARPMPAEPDTQRLARFSWGNFS